MTIFPFPRKFQHLMAFSKHCEKGENAGNQHFLLFTQCFLLYQKDFADFGPN